LFNASAGEAKNPRRIIVIILLSLFMRHYTEFLRALFHL
jgi:hypothetical protein